MTAVFLQSYDYSVKKHTPSTKTLKHIQKSNPKKNRPKILHKQTYHFNQIFKKRRHRYTHNTCPLKGRGFSTQRNFRQQWSVSSGEIPPIGVIKRTAGYGMRAVGPGPDVWSCLYYLYVRSILMDWSVWPWYGSVKTCDVFLMRY